MSHFGGGWRTLPSSVGRLHLPTPPLAETSNPYLPMQSEDVNIYLEAEMVGELVLENGCLRAKGGAEGNALLI